jgi:ubiquitin carboxyl-terminal hydrolase 34
MQALDRVFRTNMIDRTSILRSPSGYVGLRNLGNTCYMNSLLTQLYMNPSFRAFMLNCRPFTANTSSRLLLETQRLFACMQNSYARSADASEFTCNIRTLDDDTIDIREQMDVDEFSNTLFMRWEEQMLSAETKREFRSFYTGKTVQQIKSKECEHVSERDDTCLAIQCDVQGKTNLSESLQSFVEGDVMEGDNKYKCEPCGKLVDAVKRTCLKEIPDHLMLQLKRFEFDLGSQRRSKINDLFEFPMAIDMSKYTFSYLADPSAPIAPDMFDLVGVVVHKGQADHGHYVSYIRVRPTTSEGPVWLQFDDADVTRFNPADIPEACYGGFSSSKDGTLLSFQPSPSPKSFNGYMLFYQRTSTIEVRSWDAPKKPDHTQQVPIPSELAQLVTQDNAQLLEAYNLFSVSHQNFITEIKNKLLKLDHADHEHRTHGQIIELVWQHIASVTCRIKDQSDFDEIIADLRKVCESCDSCCFLMLRWLSTHDIEMRNFLLKSTQPRIRSSVRSFIYDALQQLRSSPNLYGLDETNSTPDLTESGALPSMVVTLSNLAKDELHHNPRAWDDFWGLLADIAHLGSQECWSMIQQGLLTVCIELFMINCDRSIQLKYSRVVDLFRRKVPSHNHLIELVALLLDHIDLKRYYKSGEPGLRMRLFDKSTNLFPLTTNEYKLLESWNEEEQNLNWISSIFDKWDSSREGPGTGDFYPGEIIRHLLRGRLTQVESLLITFKSNIKTLEIGYAEPYLRAACQFCQFCPSKEYIQDMVNFMNSVSAAANPTNDNDGYNGYWCFTFYQALHEIHMGNRNEDIKDAGYFQQLVLEGVQLWAPPLLTFERNFSVGSDTYKLLKLILFSPQSPDPMLDIPDELRVSAIRNLYVACTIRAQHLLENYPAKPMLNPIMSAMRDCKDQLIILTGLEEAPGTESLKHDGDTGLIDQFEGQSVFLVLKFSRVISNSRTVFKNAYETLPLLQDDDLARSGELAMEWDLDAADDALGEASDMTEGSDDADELGP